jgi:hypothetical protein
VDRPVAILYEHPLWFEPLFAELERRGIPYARLDAGRHAFDPSERESPYSLVVNRMSPSAWTRGHAGAIFHALDYLAYLEGIGANVLNGSGPYSYELSKARQCALFARLGIRYPRTRVVNDRVAAVAAAAQLRFPVLVKPNVGGSGAGIVSFDTIEELEAAELDFGLDGTALVQERIPAKGESIVRVEILGGELLYAIRILLVPGSFNLCPADYCELPGVADGVSGRGLPIEAFEPPANVVADARRIAAAAGMDVCGIEYVVDERDGLPYFYDVNALSNFVADAPNVIGFDPFVNLVDLIVELADKPSVEVGGSLGDRAPGEVLDGALAARLAEARSQLGVVE